MNYNPFPWEYHPVVQFLTFADDSFIITLDKQNIFHYHIRLNSMIYNHIIGKHVQHHNTPLENQADH